MVAAAAASAQTPHAPAPLSPRNASYTIDVRLDPEERTLEGRQRVVWRNIQQQPATEMWFHLYWNGWRNDRSTWMLENQLSSERRRRDLKDVKPKDWGSIEVHSIEWVPPDGGSAPAHELVTKAYYAAPDDANPQDRTVLVVPLPEAAEPGQEVTLDMTFSSRIPRPFARTGVRGDYYFIAHWFPAVGVFEPTGWNCRQYHAATEFYSDYGTYHVSMTVPDKWILGATGTEVERKANPDGTATHVYQQDDVHTFTWTTSPDFLEREQRFERPGLPPVDMRLLLQPEHEAQAERHFAATSASLEHYGKWYGPYRYGHITVVDPAWGSNSGGMEYPTLFTCGTRIFNPLGGDSPESVTIHEAGHQFWYGMVGNNEFDHAWLDEGLNTFSTSRTLNEVFPPRRFVRRYLPQPGRGRGDAGFIPLLLREIEVPRFTGSLDDYRKVANAEDPSTPTFRYFPGTAADITYDKTALWLGTLERQLGWDTLQAILSTFFERYRFAHPSPDDFFAVASEVSGQDLGWFFDQVYRDSVLFDYAVTSVSSTPAAPTGLVESDSKDELVPTKASKDESGMVFRSEVVVKRLGGGRFPVEVLLVFDDGREIRENWTGLEHTKIFVAELPSKLHHAVVDPERKLLLDIDYTNNSRLREEESTLPASKWASKWAIWFQDMLSTFTFFL